MQIRISHIFVGKEGNLCRSEVANFSDWFYPGLKFDALLLSRLIDYIINYD